MTASYVYELPESLNILAGTTGLDAQGAANVWAGTKGLDLLGALNAKNGTTGLGMDAVCNRLAGISLTANDLQSLILSHSPIGYWPLDDAAGSSTAADISGNSLTATATGVTFGVPGAVPANPFPTAVDVPNNVTGIVAPTSSLYQFGTGSFTLGALVRLPGGVPPTSTYVAIFGTAQGSVQGWHLTAQTTGSGVSQWQLTASDGTNTAKPAVSMPADNAWHFVWTQVNRGTTVAAVGIDLGTPTSVSASALGSVTNTNAFGIGAHDATCEVQIAHVFLTASALSAGQVQAICTAARTLQRGGKAALSLLAGGKG